jgi:hypothetical protein
MIVTVWVSVAGSRIDGGPVRPWAERVWAERLRITACAERDEPHRPLGIIVFGPPAPF